MDTEKVVPEVEELQKTIVRRVVKDKLQECSPDVDISVHKDALLAFSESARIFIHYLSATANDICKEAKRQTINAEDVLKALEEIDFPELIGPLRGSLNGQSIFQNWNIGRRMLEKEQEHQSQKKRKRNRKWKVSHQRKLVVKPKRIIATRTVKNKMMLVETTEKSGQVEHANQTCNHCFWFIGCKQH
ncbi:DNA polymerase epsilon subunit 3 [Melia azedarach]|uniref:DNA polymerase epsilon subunit 3 n=1 Tax=Melia azedarach TaxID=155640 RepID=A0ACC1YN71_MELAZ|nr:DNA polymerase epsilon subunit 3 [Melia azedarach]